LPWICSQLSHNSRQQILLILAAAVNYISGFEAVVGNQSNLNKEPAAVR
jgi:hypothetical protein